MSKYVFDTYAIFEIINGNLDYEEYIDSEIVINDFIFAELCYGLFKEKEKDLKVILQKYSRRIFKIEPEWIEEAMQFRLGWKDRKVSVPDCISYFMAKKMGIKFLTGDKEFENLAEVEFVK